MTEAAHQMASNPLPPGDRRAGLGRAADGHRGRDPGRRLAAAAGRRRRRGLRARARRRRRLPREPRGDGGELPRRLVPHRRLGLALAGRLPLARGPHQGADQPRRREDLAARGRGRAARPPRRRRGRRLRRARREVRRDRRRRRRHALGGRASDELRAHCAERLAAFKVPARVHVLDAIPKGPTGKVQRRLLAEQLRVRVAVLGAGAIGAYVGAALARGGAEVALIARGAHLAALRANGVSVHSPRGDFHARPAGDRRPRRDRAGRRRLPRPEGLLVRAPRARCSRRCCTSARPSSRPRTASRGGTSTATAGPTTAAASRPSTPAARRARRSLPSARSAASSTARPSSRRPASSATSRARASRSASPTARAPSAACAFAEAMVAGGLKAPGRARRARRRSGSS